MLLAMSAQASWERHLYRLGLKTLNWEDPKATITPALTINNCRDPQLAVVMKILEGGARTHQHTEHSKADVSSRDRATSW